MQYAFSGNVHTFPAEALVSKTMLESAHIAVREGYVMNDAMESRDSAAYGIMMDYLHGLDGIDEDIVNELRRLYPDTADEADLSYYEYVHDI